MGITKVRLTKEEIIAAVRSENYGDSDLSSFASLSGSGLIERKSEGVIEAVPVTDYIKTLLNDASSAEVRTTLGLGSIATASTSSYLPITGGTLTGALIATSFSGVGTALTALNASNLTTGTVPDAQISGAYTGITNLTGSGTATFGAFSGSGASLTALNASNISTGTINAARLPASYLPLTGGTLTGALIATSFSGVGTALTALNASNLTTGTVPDAQISGAYTGITNLTGSGTATFGAFSGSGASLTALNASNISTGTLNAARLPDTYLPLAGGIVTGALRLRSLEYTAAIEISNLGKTEAGLSTSYVLYNMKSTNAGGTLQNGFHIYSYNNNAYKSIPFTILDNDNVGIGLVNPSTKLQVAGTITTTDMIVSAATPSTSPTTGASRVTGGQGVQGNQYVGGFSSLGGDASHPGIKIKVLTGTTAATQGGLAGYAHGVGSTKVVSVYVMVKSASAEPISIGELIPSGHQQRPGCQFDFLENGMAGVFIYNHPTNSYNILSKPLTITIIYRE